MYYIRTSFIYFMHHVHNDGIVYSCVQWTRYMNIFISTTKKNRHILNIDFIIVGNSCLKLLENCGHNVAKSISNILLLYYVLFQYASFKFYLDNNGWVHIIIL